MIDGTIVPARASNSRYHRPPIVQRDAAIARSRDVATMTCRAHLTLTQARPLVSIIVAAYNHERYIEACLDSVLAIDYPAIELLVWDDGSADRTHAIALAWADRHPELPVKVWTAPNQGVARVLNAATMLHANGEYVVTLASDDRLLPGGLRTLVDAIESSPGAEAAFGDARVIAGAGEVVREWNMPEVLRSRMARNLVPELIVNWAVAGPVLMYRRQVMGEIGWYNPALRVEDWDLYLRLAARGGLRFVDELVAEYRIHGQNESRNPRTERYRMHEARQVALARARDFGGRPRFLLGVKALYLTCLILATMPGSPARLVVRPLRALRRRVA